MKILTALTAGLIAAAGFAAAPASAQDRVVVRERTVTPANTHVVVRERTTVRHDRDWHGPRARTRCDWRWPGHHRVRVCRTVRWR